MSFVRDNRVDASFFASLVFNPHLEAKLRFGLGVANEEGDSDAEDSSHEESLPPSNQPDSSSNLEHLLGSRQKQVQRPQLPRLPSSVDPLDALKQDVKLLQGWMQSEESPPPPESVSCCMLVTQLPSSVASL